MRGTALREALREGRSALGTLVLLDGGSSARLLSRLGYEFLIFDLQHAAFDLSGIEAVLHAMKGTACSPLARVHPWRPDEIEWVLDLGAHGVVVPMVNSVADAQRAVDACRYPPEGSRSVGSMRNVLERGSDYMREANVDVLCIVQIEHIDAVNNIDEILAVNGIDAVLPGHVDLAFSMGHAPIFGDSISNTMPPPVADALRRIDDACAAHGVPVIPVAGTPSEVRIAVEKGQRIVCCNSDFHLLRAAAASQVEECMGILSDAAPMPPNARGLTEEVLR